MNPFVSKSEKKHAENKRESKKESYILVANIVSYKLPRQKNNAKDAYFVIS